jgi:hypothetical protein
MLNELYMSCHFGAQKSQLWLLIPIVPLVLLNNYTFKNFSM